MNERRLLIVSPHFPPGDAVDMHRVRMNLRHYRNHGWRPTVLAVEPESSGRRIDPDLLSTIPDDVEIVRVGALPLALLQSLGISDVSLRAFTRLGRAGDAIICRRKIDLVFFSTTMFLTFPLGRRWLKRFGVPFVLDFQDPWATAPPSTLPFRRRGLKHRIMRSLHAWAEAATVPYASGIIAVSEPYIKALRQAYPGLEATPADAIPFGFSAADFDIASKTGIAWRPFGQSAEPFALYAGRIADAMVPALKTLLSAMRTTNHDPTALFSQLCAGFLGTGYQLEDNTCCALPLAELVGLSGRVAEKPDRVSLIDSLASLLAADVLILLGSGDLSYQPSKLYQLMATRKPILCVAPADSRVAAQVRHLRSVILLECDQVGFAERVATAATRLSLLSAAGPTDTIFDERDAICGAGEASALAARECMLFDRALINHAKAKPNAGDVFRRSRPPVLAGREPRTKQDER